MNCKGRQTSLGGFVPPTAEEGIQNRICMSMNYLQFTELNIIQLSLNQNQRTQARVC